MREEYQKTATLSVVAEPQLDIKFSVKPTYSTSAKKSSETETLNVLSLF